MCSASDKLVLVEFKSTSALSTPLLPACLMTTETDKYHPVDGGGGGDGGFPLFGI